MLIKIDIYINNFNYMIYFNTINTSRQVIRIFQKYINNFHLSKLSRNIESKKTKR